MTTTQVHYLTCPACKHVVEVYEKQPQSITCGGCGKTIILVADLFCGAGGTSTGAVRAIKSLGAEVILVCVNHWPLAIDTHKLNHPEAMHYIEDITAADPLTMVPWGFLHVLCASPECTHFSRARGGKPVNNQSRMAPSSVLEWLRVLDVQCLLIENVPEFQTWGPVDANDQPVKTMKGIHFEEWVKQIKRLGYKVDFTVLNAADYGDATTRKRFFLIARKDGVKVKFPAPSHSREGGAGLQKWRAAREMINWKLPGRSIFDDPKYIRRKLSINTRRRIAAGLRKQNSVLAPYFIRAMDLEAETGGSAWPETFTLQQRAHATPRTLAQPIHAVTASWNGGNTLVNPVVEPFIMANRSNNVPRGLDEPIFTATAENMGNLYQVKPELKPFLVQNRIRQDGDRVNGVDVPVKTITGHGGGALVEGEIKPFTFASRFDNTPHDVKDPIPTITNRKLINLVETTLEPVILGQQSGSAGRTPDKPLPTVATAGAISLTQPELVVFHGSSNTADVEKPLPCQPTHAKLGLMEPTLVKYYGNEHQGLSVEDPLDTVTTKDRFGLAEASIISIDQSGQAGPGARSVNQPLSTLVTKANTAVAEPVLLEVNHEGARQSRTAEEPLIPATTKRSVGLAEPMVRPATDEEIEAMMGEVHADTRRFVWVYLADVGEWVLHKLDILFRMLSNPELAASHSFNTKEHLYEFKGNVAEVTKQIGNSVPCAIAKALMVAIVLPMLGRVNDRR